MVISGCPVEIVKDDEGILIKAVVFLGPPPKKEDKKGSMHKRGGSNSGEGKCDQARKYK